MSNTVPTTIRLSINNEVRSALNAAKKRYPTLSDPEILKLGLSKIVTEYDEINIPNEECREIRLGASRALGNDYLSDKDEDIYSLTNGKKVHFS